MAKEQRKKDPQFVTPIGVFVWPKLNEPDYGNKKFPTPDGKYEVKVRFRADDPEVKAFLQKIEPTVQAAYEAGKEQFDEMKVAARKALGNKIVEKPPYTEVYDEETEEKTGEIEMRFKMNASGTTKSGPRAGKKWTAKPTIFDAKGNRMKSPPPIWGGTKGRIAFTTFPYFVAKDGSAGLSTRLQGVKIIELVTSGGGRSAESLGLGGDEGEYEYEAPPEDALKTDESATAGDAGEEDGDF